MTITMMRRRTFLRASGMAIAGAGLAALGCSGGGEESGTPSKAATPAAPVTKAVSAAGIEMPRPPAYSKLLPELPDALLKYHFSHHPDVVNPKPPKSGGIFHPAGYSAPPHWNPLENVNSTAVSNYPIIYNGLLRMDQGARPGLDNTLPKATLDTAESWEQPDPQTWVFKLRSDVTWQDIPPLSGRAMTAQDVVTAYEAHRKSLTTGALFAQVDRIDAPDARTVRFHTVTPFAPLIDNLISRWALIVSPEALEKGADFLRKTPIGTGAFTLERHDQGNQLVYARNPRYWKKDAAGNQLPYVDKITRSGSTDTAAVQAAFVAKQYHCLGLGGYVGTLDWLKKVDGLVVQGHPAYPQTISHIRFNLAKGPWTDQRVRQAMSMAVNRQAIIDTVFQGDAIQLANINYAWFGLPWPLTLDKQGAFSVFNPSEAKKLMDAAGYAKGFEAKVLTDGNAQTVNQIGPALFDMLKEIGIKLSFDVKPTADYNTLYGTGKFEELIMATVIDNAPDPHLMTWGQFHTKSTRNNMRLSDPALDLLLDKQATQFKFEERSATLFEIQKQLWDKAYMPLFPTGNNWNGHHPFVHNLADHASGSLTAGGAVQYERVWLDS